MWAVGVNTEEGVRVSYVLRENTYPFLALIVLKQSRMVVCERVEGGVEGVEIESRSISRCGEKVVLHVHWTA